MTAIGHVWPTMAIGYYTAATGNDVNQFQYMAMGIPTGIILITLLILVFKFFYRPDDIEQLSPEDRLIQNAVPIISIFQMCIRDRQYAVHESKIVPLLRLSLQT